jgi:acetyl-CoA C-acetyltransferase
MGDVIRDTVNCEPVRTPIGSYGGMFKYLTAVDLGVTVLKGLLEPTGLALSDSDPIELNGAFAAQALSVTREWKFTATDLERTNVRGSAISLGHPVGATGGRMLAALPRELRRRDGRYGLETMCIGGGQGLAAVFEKVAA